jgi:hypothetical protein
LSPLLARPQIDALLGVRSEVQHPVNVSLVMGGVHHPESYAFQLQNLTTQPFGGLALGPGEALTLPYAFTLAPQLGGGPNPRYTRACPAPWGDARCAAPRGALLEALLCVCVAVASLTHVAHTPVSVVVVTADAGGAFYSNAAFNRTVEVFEPVNSVWDVAAVVSTLVVLALGAGLLFYLLAPPSALASVSGGGAKSAKSTGATKVAALAGGAKKASAPDMSDWLKGTSADPLKGKKADKKSKKSK